MHRRSKKQLGKGNNRIQTKLLNTFFMMLRIQEGLSKPNKPKRKIKAGYPFITFKLNSCFLRQIRSRFNAGGCVFVSFHKHKRLSSKTCSQMHFTSFKITLSILIPQEKQTKKNKKRPTDLKQKGLPATVSERLKTEMYRVTEMDQG